MFSCHYTKPVVVEKINQVPITMIFGEEDTLADMNFQYDYLNKIESLSSVKFLPGYDHFNFIGSELDDNLQKMIISAWKGDQVSDKRWTNIVTLRKLKEDI